MQNYQNSRLPQFVFSTGHFWNKKGLRSSFQGTYFVEYFEKFLILHTLANDDDDDDDGDNDDDDELMIVLWYDWPTNGI